MSKQFNFSVPKLHRIKYIYLAYLYGANEQLLAQFNRHHISTTEIHIWYQELRVMLSNY